MIRGIHYFSTELKTKIDVIPRSFFNALLAQVSFYIYSPGGLYPHYLWYERYAFWVYHYPVNGLQLTST